MISSTVFGGVLGKRRRLISGVVAGALLGATAFGVATSVGGGGGTAPVSVATRANFLVSYSGAASRLSGLDASDTEDQLRDWARTALAAQLNMGTAAFRDASYDTLPVRDGGFADLADQQVGPGRSLVDVSGVLHLLVPQGDPHEGRTVGLLLDQYRTDHGSDPALVQIHHYRIDSASETIGVTADPAASTAQVRASHGYVSMPITSLADLTSFLAKTRWLSQLAVQGTTVVADGWSWPDVPSVPMTAADVTVLQKGYEADAAGNGPAPGFSLDPLPPKSAADIEAMAPSLDPDTAARILSKNWDGSIFASADDLKNEIEAALLDPGPQTSEILPQDGLPTDRAQLWALYSLLEGNAAMSQARYDGGLAGSSVGMTLMYVDYITKNWVAGVGRGVPTQAVGGFIPDPSAVTPWSECDGPTNEAGRLWFGRDDSGFSSTSDHIDIGAQATRLFERSDGPNGTEVEPSYSFGRALAWWDQHQRDIEDYEPQYQRLEQIMRWSGALEWLAHQGTALLPEAPQTAAPTTFKAWYAAHNELRERAPVDFVTPPSATQEALIFDPSRDFQDCGLLKIEGGVSLSDVYDRTDGEDYQPQLPTSVARAGLYDSSSTFDEVNGDGHIDQLSIGDSKAVTEEVDRTLSTSGDEATVGIKASGRRVISLGALKVWRSSDSDRLLSESMTAGDHQVEQDVTYQGKDFGSLYVAETANIVTVQWRSGVVDKARRALETIQAKLAGGTSGPLPAATDGVLYEMKNQDGTTWYRLGDVGQPWVKVGATTPTEGNDLVFRLGGPRGGDSGGGGSGGSGGGGSGGGSGDSGDSGAAFYAGMFGVGPHPPGSGGENYISVLPAAPGGPAVVSFTGPPDHSDREVTVETLAGQTARLAEVGDSVVAPSGDPVLGLSNAVAGAALLRDFPAIKQLLDASAQAKDHYLRAAALGDDGVALVPDADTVILAPTGSAIADRVLRALGPDLKGTAVFEVLKAHGAIPDEIEQVDDSPLTPQGKPATMYLGTALRMPGVVGVYFSPGLRSALNLGDGPIIPEALPPTYKVAVLAATTSEGRRKNSQSTQPDVQVYAGANWWLVGTVGLATAASAAADCPPDGGATPPAGTPSQGGGSTPPVPTGAGTVLLLSPAGSDDPIC